MSKAHNWLICLCLLCSACRHKDRSIATSLKNALDSNSNTLKSIIDRNYQDLDERLNDPIVHSQAIILFPRTRQLQKASNDCLIYLDSMVSGQTKDNALADRLFNYCLYQRLVRDNYITHQPHIDSKGRRHSSG